jgi:hypothetical protein
MPIPDTSTADYDLVESKLTALNNHLIACGCPSLWRNGGWQHRGEDAIQAAMLALQLHRRNLGVVRDEATGGDVLTCYTQPKTETIVVWRALRAAIHGYAGKQYAAAIDSAVQYETWRTGAGDGADGGETATERTARRLAALPGVVAGYVATGDNSKLARDTRAAFGRKLGLWVEAVLSGQAASATAVSGFSSLGALAHSLKRAGFHVSNAAWRVKLPRNRGTMEEQAARRVAREAARAARRAAREAAREAARAREVARSAARYAALTPEQRAERQARAAARYAALTPEQRAERRAK